MAQGYASLPLAFEVNEGQTASEADYLARGRGYQIYLGSDGVVLALSKRRDPTEAEIQRDPDLGEEGVKVRDVVSIDEEVDLIRVWPLPSIIRATSTLPATLTAVTFPRRLPMTRA